MYAVPNIAVYCSSDGLISEICNCLYYCVKFLTIVSKAQMTMATNKVCFFQR